MGMVLAVTIMAASVQDRDTAAEAAAKAAAKASAKAPALKKLCTNAACAGQRVA